MQNFQGFAYREIFKSAALVYFYCGLAILLLLLFQRNLSVGPVFMTQTVFQSLLVDHIWNLESTITSDNIMRSSCVNIIIFNCGPLNGCFFCFGGLFRQVQDFYNQRFKLSLIVVLFWMVCKKKLFRKSSVKYRTFSEGPM